LAVAGAGEILTREDAEDRASLPRIWLATTFWFAQDMLGLRRQIGTGASLAACESRARLRGWLARRAGRSDSRKFLAAGIAGGVGSDWWIIPNDMNQAELAADAPKRRKVIGDGKEERAEYRHC